MSTGDVRRICEFVDALNELPNIGGGVCIEDASLVFSGEYEQYDCGHHAVPPESVRAYIEWLPDLEMGGQWINDAYEASMMHEDGGYVITSIEA